MCCSDLIAAVKFYHPLWGPLNIQHREQCTRRLESTTETGRIPGADFVVFGLSVNVLMISVPLRSCNTGGVRF
jgi:hypothetical protein